MKKNKPTISDFDRGYWAAVQNVLSLNVRADRQTAEQLIKQAGLDHSKCLALIDENSFNGDILMDIVNEIYPAKNK